MYYNINIRLLIKTGDIGRNVLKHHTSLVVT